MARFRRPVLWIEYQTTRDTVVDEVDGGWTCHPTPPPGDGWQVADASSDRKTRWRRVQILEAKAALREAHRIALEGERR